MKMKNFGKLAVVVAAGAALVATLINDILWKIIIKYDKISWGDFSEKGI